MSDDIFEVLLHPHPILKKKTKIVEKFDEDLKDWSEKMFRTMNMNFGIGLAAPQVGDLRRAFVMDVTTNYSPEEFAQLNSMEPLDIEDDFEDDIPEKDGNPLVVINPEIINSSGESIYEEGCLSIPGVRQQIVRNAFVELKYQDLTGKEVISQFEKLEAVCVQHELDHLNGMLIFDRTPIVRRSFLEKKYLKSLKSKT